MWICWWSCRVMFLVRGLLPTSCWRKQKKETHMVKKSALLSGSLSLLLGMVGLAVAGTHADCIKNCIDIRTVDGQRCLSEKNAALKQCETTRAACLAAAKDDAAKRACKKADLECKAAAEGNYLTCIRTADAAVKRCKDDCPPDKKPNISISNQPAAPARPGTIRGFDPQPEPPGVRPATK